jgi:hypothetical protein
MLVLFVLVHSPSDGLLLIYKISSVPPGQYPGGLFNPPYRSHHPIRISDSLFISFRHPAFAPLAAYLPSSRYSGSPLPVPSWKRSCITLLPCISYNVGHCPGDCAAAAPERPFIHAPVRALCPNDIERGHQKSQYITGVTSYKHAFSEPSSVSIVGS